MIEYLEEFWKSTNERVSNQMQADMDANVLDRLKKLGCPLNHLHEIDDAFVCEKQTAQALAVALKRVGLNVNEPTKDGTWLECTEMASPLSMPERTRELRQIANQLRAEYDGWGSSCPTFTKKN